MLCDLKYWFFQLGIIKKKKRKVSWFTYIKTIAPHLGGISNDFAIWFWYIGFNEILLEGKKKKSENKIWLIA